MGTLDRGLIQALLVFSATGEIELDHAHASSFRIPKDAAVFEQEKIAFFVLVRDVKGLARVAEPSGSAGD